MNAGNKGLANLGNTCYMNAALQCLSHLLEFHPKNNDFLKENKSKNSMCQSWIQLQDHLWSDDNRNPIAPKNFLQTFMTECDKDNKEFHNFHQNDTEEFIEYFMDLLHKSMKKQVNITIEGEAVSNVDKLAIKAIKDWSSFFKNDYSYIIKKFYSQLLSITSCTECDYIATNHDPIMVLSLELPPGNITLYDCLDSFTKKTTLDCDNSWKCEQCGNYVEPEKKILLWKSSNVLILLLKRYTSFSKDNRYIEFPVNLDMSKYSLDYNSSGSSYTLSGMCIQQGGFGGGHYYAICKNPLNDEWNIYNDTQVTSINESELLKENPYCLFYRRL